MLELSGINLIKFVVVAGLAFWSFLEGVGLIQDFTGAQKMVGKIMNMELIETSPVVQTSLINRRVSGSFWHKACAIILILFNFITATLLFVSLYSVAYSGWTVTGNEDFLIWANYGMALFLFMSFALSFVGLWFAYYIKQNDLMITHFVLIVFGITAATLINLS
ncbi:DUF2165 family protein [Pantoea sp. FN0307]|uniref:DUF2165 family protein n=1 Tax=Pantoea sp. FN0307 TaxID=3418560 RepID=UPI003CF67D92